MRQPPVEDHEQRERLDPGRDGDGQRDARAAERSDEDDRERAVDGHRADRGDDRRERVLARVERPGEDRDQRVRGQPDQEGDQRRGDEVEVRLADLAAAEQDLDDRRADGPRPAPRSGS